MTSQNIKRLKNSPIARPLPCPGPWLCRQESSLIEALLRWPGSAAAKLQSPKNRKNIYGEKK